METINLMDRLVAVIAVRLVLPAEKFRFFHVNSQGRVPKGNVHLFEELRRWTNLQVF